MEEETHRYFGGDEIKGSTANNLHTKTAVFHGICLKF